MFRMILLTITLQILNGCTIGYPSSKYRCFESKVESGLNVPSMPNCSENNKNLEGTDTDSDGVRDDVQRYIASIEMKHDFLKRSLIQYARALQTTLLEYRKEERAQLNFSRTNLAINCLYSSDLGTPNSINEIIRIRKKLTELQLNTYKRRFAHRIWSSNVETQLVPSIKPQDACEFDIATMQGARWR